jgi:hypothetical protein
MPADDADDAEEWSKDQEWSKDHPGFYMWFATPFI